MKKIFFSCLALTIAALTQAAQPTTVFSLIGNEKSSATVTSEGVDLGAPAVTFKSTHITYAGAQADDPSVSTANYIRVPNKQANPASGRNMMMGNLADFAVPFDTMLNKIKADSIEWSFIARYQFQTGTNGLGNGKRGLAVILAMDGENTETANGYAVVSIGNKKYAFARITNGLDTITHVDTLITMPVTLGSECRVPVTMKVVYIPASNTWKFYYVVGTGKGTELSDYILPDSANYIYAGSVVDAAHTGKKMKSFGFYNCYSGNVGASLFVRHFSVKTYLAKQPQPTTPSIVGNIYNSGFTSTAKVYMNGKEKGTPAVTYTHAPVVKSGTTPAEPYCYTDGLVISRPTANKTDTGRNILTAPLANFAAPFTAKLSEISADSIAWAFNMRNNRQFYFTGLGDGLDGYAVALVASSADLTTGCGYALVMGDKAGSKGAASKKYRLVHYNNGLTATGNTTKIVLSDTIAKKAFTSVRIVYVPSTNMWKLYTYYNTEDTKFVKPSESAYTFQGSAVDATYTSTDMTAFGFMLNYTGSNAGTLYIRNFSLSAYYKQDTISESLNNSALLTAKDGMTTNLQLVRSLKGGMWNTICLPFDMSAAQISSAFGANCQLAQLSSAQMQGETLDLDFDDQVTSIEAGEPYLIKPVADVTDPATVFGVTLSKEANTNDQTLAQMTGIFSPTELAASQNTLFLGTENTLYYVDQTSTLSGLRAYFTLSDEAAKASVRRVNIGRQVVTELAAPASTGKGVCKTMKDGQLIIIREGVQYNAQGTRL